MLERCMWKFDEYWDAIYTVKMIMDFNGNYGKRYSINWCSVISIKRMAIQSFTRCKLDFKKRTHSEMCHINIKATLD